MKARHATSLLSGTAALLAAVGGVSWYYANRLTGGASPAAVRGIDRLEVVGADRRHIDLRGPDAARAGVWGLRWDGGYGRLREVLTAAGGVVTRRFEQLDGIPDADVGAFFDAYAFPEDPAAVGVPWRDVTYHSPLGDMPAWEFATPEMRRAGTTWAIFVHGRHAGRHESFRALRVAYDLGLPCLAIAYRNDPGAPGSPDGRSHLGATEWEDVAGAVQYALDHGASDVVLVGFSMGGACVLNMARLSDLAGHVRGMVLEAPVLDWGPVLRRAAVERGLPAPVLALLLPTTMAMTSARVGIDWRSLNHLLDPSTFTHPKLLIHGTADATVPVRLADALADARPDIVRYLRVPDAGHVRNWNVDPPSYETALRVFLRRVLEDPSVPTRQSSDGRSKM